MGASFAQVGVRALWWVEGVVAGPGKRVAGGTAVVGALSAPTVDGTALAKGTAFAGESTPTSATTIGAWGAILRNTKSSFVRVRQ